MMITLEEYWEGKEVEVVQNKKGQKVHAFRPGTSTSFCLSMRNKDVSQPYFNDFVHPLSSVITCQSCQGSIEWEVEAVNHQQAKKEWARQIRLSIEIDDDIRDWFVEKFTETFQFGNVEKRLINNFKADELINSLLRDLKESENKVLSNEFIRKGGEK